MSLDVGNAFSEAIDRVSTQAAALLIAIYTVTSTIQTAATQDIMRELILELREWAQDELSPEEYQEFLDATEPALNDLHLELGLDLVPAIALFFVAAIAGVVVVTIAIDAFASGASSIGDIDTSGVFWHTLNVIVGGIVFVVLFWIGLSFFVLPGLVVLFLFVFFPIAVVVDDDNFFSAFGSSIETTTDNVGQTLLLLVVLFVVGFLAAIGSSLLTTVLPGTIGALVGVVVTAVISLFLVAILTRAYVGDNPATVDDDADTDQTVSV